MAEIRVYPAESSNETDARTGATIRRITSHPAIHHHPFFMIPAYDAQMRYTFFASERSGSPQIFVEDRASGNLLQLTDRDDISDWSMHPSTGGRYVYFTAGTGGWRVEIETGREEQLVDFEALARQVEREGAPGVSMSTRGGVAAAMGTTALSHCDRYWAVKFSSGSQSSLVIVDTVAGNAEIILRRDSIAHLQFCPDDNTLLFYAGPLTDRVWCIRRDGSDDRRLYQRAPGEWITHESWIPGTRELAFVDWPKGVRAVHVDTGEVRPVASFNAWHPICNDQGTMMVTDTNFPDIGLQIFDPRDGIGTPSTICYPEASSMGEHWAGPFPYDHGPIKTNAPQHTHPHPRFSPDGRYVLYTSDRIGFAQIYELDLASLGLV